MTRVVKFMSVDDAIKDVRSKGAAADTVRGPGGHLARGPQAALTELWMTSFRQSSAAVGEAIWRRTSGTQTTSAT